MTAALWKHGTEERIRLHVMDMDDRFQRAMREELREMAAERGLRLIVSLPAPPAKVAKARSRRPRDVISVDPSSLMDVPLTSAQRIIRQVCEKHGFTRGELFSARRNRPLVAARHEAMYRLSKETSMSFPAIGRRMGGKDHSSVIHGVRQHERRLQEAAAQ